MDKAEQLIAQLGETRYELPYDIDGAVMKLNSLAGRERLGSTAKFPRWAAAFKYPPEIKETVLQDIVVQVGRTGVLTPRAIVAPVHLAGTTVTSRDAPQPGLYHRQGYPHRRHRQDPQGRGDHPGDPGGRAGKAPGGRRAVPPAGPLPRLRRAGRAR